MAATAPAAVAVAAPGLTQEQLAALPTLLPAHNGRKAGPKAPQPKPVRRGRRGVSGSLFLGCWNPFCSGSKVRINGDDSSSESGSDGEINAMELREGEDLAAKMKGCTPTTCTTIDTQRSGDFAELFSCMGSDATDGSAPLFFELSSFQVPHPDKAHYGGEDACFASKHALAAGVADGVGEWGNKLGVNPRNFALEVMAGAQRAAEAAASRRWWAVGDVAAEDLAQELIADGYAASSSFGAATACTAALNPLTREIGVASLGDSGARLLRPSAWTSNMVIVDRTTEQHHGFNRPYQLSRLPGPEEFPRLRAEGLNALVQAAMRAGTRRGIFSDPPSDARRFTFEAQEGDLLIMGSDGLFDNLTDDDLCRAVDEAIAEAKSPGSEGSSSSASSRRSSSSRRRRGGAPAAPAASVAEAVAFAASARSEDPDHDSPFSLYARKNGLRFSGGKLDDITVVAAWITA